MSICSANATLTMSTVPTIKPIATISKVSRRTSASLNTDMLSCPVAASASTGGSVPTCTAKANTPMARNTAAANVPACGSTATLSPTEIGGPAMKVTSSRTVSSE
ncbi:hypothetical protein D3C79_887590 [compost metagenome]